MPAPKKYHTEEERLAAIRASQRKSRARPEYREYQNKYHKDRSARDPVFQETVRRYSREYHRRIDPETRKARARKTRLQSDPRRFLVNDAKRRAAKRGLEFSICVDDIAIPSQCPVLGISLEHQIGKGGKSPHSPSLDRFDNTKGYTKDNVRVISLRANQLKNDATLDEMRRIVAYMEGK